MHDIEVDDEGVAADVNDDAKDDMGAMYVPIRSQNG